MLRIVDRVLSVLLFLFCVRTYRGLLRGLLRRADDTAVVPER